MPSPNHNSIKMPSSKTNQEGPHGCFASLAQAASGTSGRGRIISFDLARGFTVLFMPMIHVVMLYSNASVHQSFLATILRFIAEGPGAQLFMLLMGVNFALKESASPNRLKKISPSPSGEGHRVGCFKRAFYLLLAAYALNIFKFIVPLAFKLLPDNLLRELQLSNDLSSAQFFFFIGDILHFAAIASIILWLVTRTRFYPLISAILAIVIMFVSPYLWDLKTGIQIVDHIIGLLNAHPPETFFPAFPWATYPLIGLTLGYALTQFDKELVFKRMALTGAALIIISLALPATPPETRYLAFYRSLPADTLFHIGIVLLWLQLWNWLSKKIASNPVFRLLSYCSRHITSIYIIQWILICWCIAFTGYGKLGLISSAIWMVSITTITLLLAYLISYATRKSI